MYNGVPKRGLNIIMKERMLQWLIAFAFLAPLAIAILQIFGVIPMYPTHSELLYYNLLNTNLI